MVSHCANPACGVPLLYLRDGRLFQFEVRCKASKGLGAKSESPNPSRHVSHYWLCGRCSAQLTLEFHPTSGVVPVAITEARLAQAAAG
jgi:hypothetical protein